MGHTLDDYAKDALGVIDALGLERPVLLGHSMGARVAARLAATAAERVDKLILVDPPVTGPDQRPASNPVSYYLDLIEETQAGGGLERIRKSYPAWPEEHVALRAEWLPTCDLEAVARSFQTLHDEAFEPDLRAIRCPTLLLYAGAANVVRDSEAAAIVGMLGDNGAAVRIDDAGHMIPWDNFAAFTNETDAFLSSAQEPTRLNEPGC